MQPSSTRVAIRERDLPEIMDLSLRVVRTYAAPLAATFVIGIAPFALLNYFLLTDVAGKMDIDINGPEGYLWAFAMLTFWELPLATAPATLFLGQVLFQQKIDPRRLVGDLIRSLPQLLLFQGLLRGLLTPMGITWLLPMLGWPFLNEIILLERNPLMKRRGGGLSTYKRSGNLHADSRGDLFARWLLVSVAGAGLVTALWFTCNMLRIETVGIGEFDAPMYTVYLPLSVWTVLAFTTVIRFLSYLDLRIRREGWEVELSLRMEAAKLARI